MRDAEIRPSSIEAAAYWQAAADRRLTIKKCLDCNQPHFYPRSFCPHCFSENTEWIDSSGRGVIFSFSVMRRVEKPYVIAYVTLDEGVSMISNIATDDVDAVRVGQRVRVSFLERNGRTLPVFEFCEQEA